MQRGQCAVKCSKTVRNAGTARLTSLLTTQQKSVMPLGSVASTSKFSGFNIKKTQDCYQNLLCNMVPILHIHHCCMLYETICLANNCPFKLSVTDLAFTDQKILSTAIPFINVFGSTSMDFARSIN